MTEPEHTGGEAVPKTNRIALDPVAGVMHRRATAAENSELMLAAEIASLRATVAELQLRLAERGED